MSNKCCYVQYIDHVRYIVGNAKQSAAFYCESFGFSPFAYQGLETGERKRTTHVIKQNDIVLAFTSTVQSNDAEIFTFLQKHGDSIYDIALHVSNVQDAYTQACANGAIPIQPPVTTENDMEYAVIGTPFGDWVHTLIHRPSSAAKQVFLPKYKQLNKPSSVKTYLEFIDHVAIAIENDTLPKLIAWYSAVLGFERFLSSDDDDSQSGVNIQSATTGLKTMVVAPAMYCNNSTTTTDTKEFKFVFVEPVSNTQNKSQIQEFLDYHSGPGVAHIAVHTSDILAAVNFAKNKGIPFIDVPNTYYEMWQERPEYCHVKENWKLLEQEQILVDFHAYKHSNYTDKQMRYLLQTFTTPLQDRPTFYMEFICRHGSNGFGKGTVFQCCAKI